MGSSIYDINKTQLFTLGFFTEIQESFEWDEEKANRFCEDVRICLESKEVTGMQSFTESISIFKSKLKVLGYPEFQINLVIEIIKLQAKEIIELDKMEVH